MVGLFPEKGGQDLKSFYDRPRFSGIDDSFLKKVV